MPEARAMRARDYSLGTMFAAILNGLPATRKLMRLLLSRAGGEKAREDGESVGFRKSRVVARSAGN